MSNHETAARSNALRNTLAASLATFAAAGALAPQAAEATPVETRGAAIAQRFGLTNTHSAQFNGLKTLSREADHAQDGSENAPIKAEIAKQLRHDTLRLTVLGCSAAAIWADKEKTDLAGAITAEHCNLQDSDNRRIVGSDGKIYIVQPQPVLAQRGGDLKHMKTIAKIDRFITAPTGDTSHDLVLGVAKGHTPKEVQKLYAADALTPDQLKHLKVNDDLYMSGYPVDQPGKALNNSKAPALIPNERQTFKMKIAGMGVIGTTKTSRVKVLYATTTPTKDGAECSFGASGSAARVWIKNKLYWAGTLTWFNDLSGTIPGLNGGIPGSSDRSTLIKDSPAAICGFSYDQVPEKEAYVLHAVRSTGEIPGYVSPEAAIEQVREKVNDPNQPKNVLDGVASFFPLKGGGDLQPTIIDRPIVERVPGSHGTVLVADNPAIAGNLDIQFVPDDNLKNLSFYGHEPVATNLNIVPTSASLDANGELLDTAQQKIAVLQDPATFSFSNQQFYISVTKDKFSFIAATPGMH